MADIYRIKSIRHCDAMVAMDNFDLIVVRVRKLLSYGRRMSMTQRYTYVDSPPELHVGLTLDEQARPGGISESHGDDGCHFGVNLAPGINGFSFSAYASDGNAAEEVAWQRYHESKNAVDHWARRRNMTMVTLTGGMDDDFGPARDDLLIIRHWNEHGVCDERVIGFDTDAYWTEQRAVGEAGDTS